MSDNSYIRILIAEDNHVSRDMMSKILQTQGYGVLGAIDGESAIRVVNEHPVDMALVDINMAPKGGFDFVRWLVAQGRKLPVVIITGSNNAGVLSEASSLGVVQVLQKPVEPKRLLQTVERVLKKAGLNPTPLAIDKYDTKHAPEELMAKTLELAAQNAAAKKGGPYAALIATADGEIIATGTSGHSTSVDPTAHAEVMAIRKAAEKLGTTDLSHCILYCSSEPTRVGQAVIISADISKVYYGLSHDDLEQIRSHRIPAEPDYEQICRNNALAMYKHARPEKP